MPKPKPPEEEAALDTSWYDADILKTRQMEISEYVLDRDGAPAETEKWRQINAAKLEELPDLAMVRLLDILRHPGPHRIAFIGSRIATLSEFRLRILARLDAITRVEGGDIYLSGGAILRFDHVGRGAGGLAGFKPTVVFADLDVPFGVLRTLIVEVSEIIPWA